jgi:ATP-dependent DNA helicase RecG
MSIDVIDLIEELNATDEHERIEAKTGLGKAAIKSVVAFSNEPRLDGGYLIFGVSKRDAADGPRYEVVGVPDPDKLSSDLSSQCATMLNRRIRPRVVTETVEGTPVVAAYVPEAQPAQKPVFIKSDGLEEGTYRRIGSTDQQCTDADLEEIYQERSGDTYDASLVSGAEFDDIDSDAVQDYRKTRAQKNPDAQELKWDDRNLLRALRCVEKKGGTLRPTVAGILLFGSKMALRRLFPAMRIDYTRVPGREWMEDPDRRYISSVEIRAPLLEAIRRAQAAVVDDLPRGFSLPEGSLQRTDDPLIPRKVLREAIVNAVMHRGYRKNSAIHIVRYANRIEIRNPGYSLIGVDQLGAPRSETRNPILANVLHDTGFAETKGTGIEVMRENMRSAGLAPPEFDSDRSADHFITTFYLHHFLASEDLDWLGQFKHLNLSEAQVRGLIHAREAGRIDNETYREINGVETLEASQDLRSLRDAGLLTQHERSTATYYEPTEKLLGAEPTAQGEIPFEETEPENTQEEGESDQAEEESATLSEETAQDTGESEQAEAESPQAGSQSEQAEQVSPQADLQPLPNELREAVDGLKDKASPETLREVIEQLCQWRPLSAAELAQYLGRGRRYLIHSHVKPMIERGTLERTRPQTPSSPNQKYRVPTADAEG